MKSVTIKKAGRKGKGVFANKDFEKGSTVLHYQKSRLFSGDEIPKVWKGKFRYLDTVGNNKFMIMKSPERFINHSCEPNVFIKNWKFMAMKSIKRGDEICADYALNSDYDIRLKCHCKGKNCRKLYPGSFFKLNKKLQKKYLRYLDTWFKKKYRKRLAKLKEN